MDDKPNNNSQVELPEDVVLSVMESHEVERPEAEKRLQLLFRSGLMDDPRPTNAMWQQRVDGFLSQPSEKLTTAITAHTAITNCLNDKKFVRAYDQKNGTNFAKFIRLMNEGETVIGWERELKKFEEFVIKTVVDAYYSKKN